MLILGLTKLKRYNGPATGPEGWEEVAARY